MHFHTTTGTYLPVCLVQSGKLCSNTESSNGAHRGCGHVMNDIGKSCHKQSSNVMHMHLIAMPLRSAALRTHTSAKVHPQSAIGAESIITQVESSWLSPASFQLLVALLTSSKRGAPCSYNNVWHTGSCTTESPCGEQENSCFHDYVLPYFVF